MRCLSPGFSTAPVTVGSYTTAIGSRHLVYPGFQDWYFSHDNIYSNLMDGLRMLVYSLPKC